MKRPRSSLSCPICSRSKRLLFCPHAPARGVLRGESVRCSTQRRGATPSSEAPHMPVLLSPRQHARFRECLPEACGHPCHDEAGTCAATAVQHGGVAEPDGAGHPRALHPRLRCLACGPLLQGPPLSVFVVCFRAVSVAPPPGPELPATRIVPLRLAPRSCWTYPPPQLNGGVLPR